MSKETSKGKAGKNPVKGGVKGGSKSASAPVRRIEPAEHEFADSVFANEITMHTNTRMFTVSIYYALAAASENPLMDAVREQVLGNEHMVQVAIAGPDLAELPAHDVYPTSDSRFVETSSNARAVQAVSRIHDSVADYYGVLAAERLIRETDGQANILAVDIEEHVMPRIFLNAVAG